MELFTEQMRSIILLTDRSCLNGCSNSLVASAQKVPAKAKALESATPAPQPGHSVGTKRPKFIIVPSQPPKTKSIQERRSSVAMVSKSKVYPPAQNTAVKKVPQSFKDRSAYHAFSTTMNHTKTESKSVLPNSAQNSEKHRSTKEPAKSFQKYPSFDSLNTSASAKVPVSELQISSSQDSPNRKSSVRYTQDEIERKKKLAMEKRNQRLKLQKPS